MTMMPIFSCTELIAIIWLGNLLKTPIKTLQRAVTALLYGSLKVLFIALSTHY